MAHPDPLVWIGGGPLRGERKGRGKKEGRLGDRRGGEKTTRNEFMVRGRVHNIYHRNSGFLTTSLPYVTWYNISLDYP